MLTMISGFAVDPTKARKLSDLPGAVTKMSDEEIAKMKEKLNPPEPPPVGQVDADNDPSKRYAVLVKDGQVIATFYTSGLLETPNSVRLPDNLEWSEDGMTDTRVHMKQMQEMHGGTFEYVQDAKMAGRSKNSDTLMKAQILGQTEASPNKFQVLFQAFNSSAKQERPQNR